MDEKDTPQATEDEIGRKLNQWRRANPQVTLTEIEEAVEAELAKLRRRLVEEMIQEEVAGSQLAPDCSHCGQEMVKNGRRRRKLKSKEGQTIRFDRQQWRCLRCGTTLFPPG